jgi:2-polyprenyl-6-methoxyphenol hydroxylase-like FAD-dependent oxidoreductase
MRTRNVLVAGAGIAGLGAALALGDGTRRVTILDRDPPPPDARPRKRSTPGNARARRSFATATPSRPAHHADPRPLSRSDGRIARRGRALFGFEEALPPTLKQRYVRSRATTI